MTRRIYTIVLTMICLTALSLPVQAQDSGDKASDTTKGKPAKDGTITLPGYNKKTYRGADGRLYVLEENQKVKRNKKGKQVVVEEEPRPLFGGVAASVDLVGFVMKAAGSWANMEVAARLNFKEKFFPLVELGIGSCDRNGKTNENNFSVTAPYYRIGMDYNINKKQNGNRFFAGARYAFTSFNYDFSNPAQTDRLYGVAVPLSLEGMHGHNQWLELVLGFETKLWSFIRLGANFRFKFRTVNDYATEGEPWFVPGFGINGTSAYGATMNLAFDFGKTMKKQPPRSLYQ